MNGRLGKTMVAAAVALGALAPAAQGAVNFEPKQSYNSSGDYWVGATDLNADGLLDVTSAGFSTKIVSAFRGNGDGTLVAEQPTAAAPNGITALEAADLNGDGAGDVAVTTVTGKLRVYIGNGDGTFASGVEYTAGGTDSQDVAIRRIDNNASPDIAVANPGAHNVVILLNNGSGAFAPGGTVTPPGGAGTDPQGVALADFDRDGDNDLAIASLNGSDPGVSVAFNDGTGTFTLPGPSFGGAGAQKLVTGDLNGDGTPDIAASHPSTGVVEVFKRTTTGFDAATEDAGGPGSNNGQLAIGDLDGDGILDLAVPNHVGPNAGKASILIGRGDATFDTTSQQPAGDFPHEVAIADLNRDGNPDLISASSADHKVNVLLATPPTVSVPTTVDFGSHQPGVAGIERTITVTNNGPPRLRPTGVALGGADASQFSLVSNTCTAPANLAIGASCTIGVRFTPNGLGARNASVTIASNGGGSPHTVRLTGTGANLGLIPGNCANDQNGTAANETLTGTAFGDNLFGFAGDDILDGLAGNDCLIGGPGKDRLNGGDGNDTVEGGSGNDVASGGNGRDRMNGGSGRDRLSGGSSNDTLNGLSGNDSLSGGTGNDKLSGSTGNDKLSGGAGRNSYNGGPGNDTINARNGRVETIDCGSGRDKATVDRGDRVKRCERVSRSRR